MDELDRLADRAFGRVVEYRREFHAHPELGYGENETARRVAAALRAMGIETREGVGGTGVVGLITGAKPGKCVGLRADMDALPVAENTGLPFSSQNPGVCHACGHDLHMAMLLGCAEVLQAMKNELSGSVKLIFQPAEECCPAGGAAAMIADGVLENPHVDAMFAQHVWPGQTTGVAGVRDGVIMAEADPLEFVVRGSSGHGSEPENGVDAVVTACHIITAMQTVVSRSVSPLDSAVVTIGTIHGGERANIIAKEVKVEGTCRSLRPEVGALIRTRLGDIARNVAAAFGAQCEFSCEPGYPPVFNDSALFPIALGAMRATLGDGARVMPDPVMGSEDFAYFAQKVPSVYYWLGCRRPGDAFSPLHSAEFSPDEAAMALGIKILLRATLGTLGA